MQAQQVAWLEEVEAAVAKLVRERAGVKAQEEAWAWINGRFGEEAAAYAVRLLAEEKYKPTEVEEEKGEIRVSFSGEVARQDDEPPLLYKASPYDSAKEFVGRYLIKDGALATFYWNQHFWVWNGRCYEKAPIDKFNAAVWAFLANARTGSKTDNTRFLPKPADAEGVMKALKAGLTLDVDPPYWLDGRDGAEHILAFKNGLVDVRTGRFMPSTPRLWIHHALNYDYDPDAKCPTWDHWLDEVFEGDEETRQCVEEEIGIEMTNDIRFHKGFLHIGQQGREGKTTLAAVIEEVVGSDCYISLDITSWVSGEFSKEPLLGKKVGVFADVRFKEPKWYGQNLDPGGIDHVSKGWLLRITGGDPVTIPRKFNPIPWRGHLPMKAVLTCNHVPNLNDPMLASRFILIAFNVSFRDREDIGMVDKLKAEVSGIAARCLIAYRRLCDRGRFIQPATGLKLARSVAAKSNAYQAFSDECFIINEQGVSTQCEKVFFRWRKWCEDNGQLDALRSCTTSHHLSRQLRKNVRGLEKLKIFRRSASDKREYVGIRLKTVADFDIEDEVEVIGLRPENVVVVDVGNVVKRRRFLRRI